MNSRDVLKWRVPAGWYFRKTWKELRDVYTVSAFARIILPSLAVAAVAWFWIEREFGPLNFSWARAIALSILVGLVCFVLSAVQSFAPPAIEISAKGITVWNVPSVRLRFQDLRDIALHEGAVPTLTFSKGVSRREYAIARGVNLDELRDVLEHYSGRPVQIVEERDA